MIEEAIKPDVARYYESTIVSEGFKGGTRGAPIMPRDAVSRTANVERTGQHKWVIGIHILVSTAYEKYLQTRDNRRFEDLTK